MLFSLPIILPCLQWLQCCVWLNSWMQSSICS